MSTSERVAPRGMHYCPGGCELCVSNSVLACHTCWPRVPLELRKALWSARKLDQLNAKVGRIDPVPRLAAARAVIVWLRANPEPAKKSARR